MRFSSIGWRLQFSRSGRRLVVAASSPVHIPPVLLEEFHVHIGIYREHFGMHRAIHAELSRRMSNLDVMRLTETFDPGADVTRLIPSPTLASGSFSHPDSSPPGPVPMGLKQGTLSW